MIDSEWCDADLPPTIIVVAVASPEIMCGRVEMKGGDRLADFTIRQAPSSCSVVR